MAKNRIEKEIDKYYKNYEAVLKKSNKALIREDRYAFAEKIIKDEFEKNDNSIEQIYKKVVLLNSLYSTNIYATFDVALNISKIKNFDKRVGNGDITLVDEIRKNLIGDSIKDFYSFSTKYCHHHNPTKYPIYDAFVEEMLIEYLYEFEPDNRIYQTKMKKYEYFKKNIDHLAELWKLSNEYLYTKLDKYLWQKGKEAE
jgi:hypothetical protein